MAGSDQRGQRVLFREPVRDPIWKDETLKRIAEGGSYWTPNGPQRGPYVEPEQPAAEPHVPGRARLRSGGSRKPAQP